MILTGHQIVVEWTAGRITIDPFVPQQVQPNSYDFRLGTTLLTYDDHVLDARRPNPHSLHNIPAEGFVLEPDRIYLGHTLETMGSAHFVPVIRGRSSVARLGLFVHVTADLIDLGSINQWTLQLHAVQPVRVYSGMSIGQVTFWRIYGDPVLYSGKYQGSRGPVASRAYDDWGDSDSEK